MCSIIKIGINSTKCYKAMHYFNYKIEEKIQYLEQNGPETSNLISIFFATDKEDSTQIQLTCQDMIDNAVLLVLDGSETSASTLYQCDVISWPPLLKLYPT